VIAIAEVAVLDHLTASGAGAYSMPEHGSPLLTLGA
jgi:hypothetical protein